MAHVTILTQELNNLEVTTAVDHEQGITTVSFRNEGELVFSDMYRIEIADIEIQSLIIDVAMSAYTQALK